METLIQTAARVGKLLAQPTPAPLSADELARACAGAMKVAR